MRELTRLEMDRVSGAADECTSSDSGNNYGGVTDPGALGSDLIEVYEGLVAATSYVIERVARAL